jgi:hypothetical protein
MFVYCLFIYDDCGLDCVASDFRMMNVELERMWKEAIVAYFGNYSNIRLEGKNCLGRSMVLLCYNSYNFHSIEYDALRS